MTRQFKSEGHFLLLSGDTFSIRENIKTIGGRWDPGAKLWKVSNNPELVEQILALGFIPNAEFTENGLSNSNDRIWSVGDFVKHVATVVNTHLSFAFWICGEISSIKKANGHVYFDLSELQEEKVRSNALRTSSIACCLWAGKYNLLSEKHGDLPLLEGYKVKLLVHCEFRKETGRLNIIVDDVDLQYTTGDLALARQNIVRQLRKRGLYDRNRTTSLAALPLKIALITAGNSRAASDFLDELKLTQMAFAITLFDCNVQGENTSANVCNALKIISQTHSGLKITSPEIEAGFDCIVITRGGGSRLDLRWFDDLEIAKAIAYAPLPVITAIGHFEDVSVADEIAFKAEKTPTGAARFLGNRVLESMQIIFKRAERSARKATQSLVRQREFLLKTEQNVAFLGRKKISNARNTLSSCEQTIRLIRMTLEKTLHRGFALVKSDQGLLLKASDFLGTAQPQAIHVELFDSATSTEVTLHAQVLKVRTDSWDP